MCLSEHSCVEKFSFFLWVLTGLLCLLIGGALIGEAVMEIIHPVNAPHRDLAFIFVTIFFGIFTCLIFFIPAAVVCAELFLDWWTTAPRLPPFVRSGKIAPLPASAAASFDGTDPASIV